MWFTIAFDARRAEHVPTRERMLGQISEATKACSMTDETLGASQATVELVHVSMMDLADNLFFISGRRHHPLRTEGGLEFCE